MQKLPTGDKVCSGCARGREWFGQVTATGDKRRYPALERR